MLDVIEGAFTDDGALPVSCQGSVDLNSPLALFGNDAKGLAFSVQLPAEGAALKPLLDACTAQSDDAATELAVRLI